MEFVIKRFVISGYHCIFINKDYKRTHIIINKRGCLFYQTTPDPFNYSDLAMQLDSGSRNIRCSVNHDEFDVFWEVNLIRIDLFLMVDVHFDRRFAALLYNFQPGLSLVGPPPEIFESWRFKEKSDTVPQVGRMSEAAVFQFKKLTSENVKNLFISQ